VLLLVLRSGRVRAPGVFCLYVAWYTGMRFFLEFLRVDQSHELFGVRLNAYVSAVVFCLAVAAFVWSQRRGGEDAPRRSRRERRERTTPEPAKKMAIPKSRRVRPRR
jgi:prolipoprotein diacylglyceryltransferase